MRAARRQAPILNLLETASDCHRLLDQRRRASPIFLHCLRGSFGRQAQPAVAEKLFYHLARIPLDEAENLNLRAAFGTA